MVELPVEPMLAAAVDELIARHVADVITDPPGSRVPAFNTHRWYRLPRSERRLSAGRVQSLEAS
jgi:hypothetical protein